MPVHLTLFSNRPASIKGRCFLCVCICAQVSPSLVFDLLDALYLRFDTLTEQYGMYKVETIGDW